jgi:anti-sigma-K factor RskA
MTGNRHISQEDLALEAMGALANEECAAVRQHLEECAECRGQLAEMTGDLALVAMSVEQHAAPAGARQRFVERIAGAPAQEQQPLRAPVIPFAPEKRAARSISWVPWVAVAAMLIICAAMGIVIYFQNQQLEGAFGVVERQNAQIGKQNADVLHARALLELLNTPAAQRVTLTTGKTPPAPSARAIYLASRGALILQASNMQPLPPNKTYELWVIPEKGAPIPAGLFRPDASGSGSVVMPPMIPPGLTAKAFAITIENAAGSATPTMPIVLSGAAPAGGE